LDNNRYLLLPCHDRLSWYDGHVKQKILFLWFPGKAGPCYKTRFRRDYRPTTIILTDKNYRNTVIPCGIKNYDITFCMFVFITIAGSVIRMGLASDIVNEIYHSIFFFETISCISLKMSTKSFMFQPPA
jgi:hypothetical protein